MLMICDIKKGLGDISWAINIAEELKRISTAKITCFFAMQSLMQKSI